MEQTTPRQASNSDTQFHEPAEFVNSKPLKLPSCAPFRDDPVARSDTYIASENLHNFVGEGGVITAGKYVSVHVGKSYVFVIVRSL